MRARRVNRVGHVRGISVPVFGPSRSASLLQFVTWFVLIGKMKNVVVLAAKFSASQGPSEVHFHGNGGFFLHVLFTTSF